MKILILAATKKEIESLLTKMDSVKEESGVEFFCNYKKHEILFSITGVGMVNMALSTDYSLTDDIDAALNIGICGSFNRNLEIGTVVNVVEDCFSELGAEDGDSFLSIEELNLVGINDVLNVEDENEQINNYVLDLLPKVNGITVNTVHGNEKSIEAVVKRFHPMVESMEGAAFMQACEYAMRPYAQIRAVSNYVERRNVANWNIPLALENLSTKVIEILDAFN